MSPSQAAARPLPLCSAATLRRASRATASSPSRSRPASCARWRSRPTSASRASTCRRSRSRASTSSCSTGAAFSPSRRQRCGQGRDGHADGNDGQEPGPGRRVRSATGRRSRLPATPTAGSSRTNRAYQRHPEGSRPRLIRARKFERRMPHDCNVPTLGMRRRPSSASACWSSPHWSPGRPPPCRSRRCIPRSARGLPLSSRRPVSHCSAIC